MQTRVISFHYDLTDTEGTALDSSKSTEPLSFLEGQSQIIPGLESVLRLMEVGDKKKINVKAEDAYGEYDEKLSLKVPRKQFPSSESVEVGDTFQMGTPEGTQDHEGPVFTVVDTDEEHIYVDGNHPLAGKDLIFDVEVTQVRIATDEELNHGHAHGAHGHGHHHEH